jgi:DNA-binding response OmpR family regulator
LRHRAIVVHHLARVTRQGPVLIVEDEPAIRELLCDAFEQDGIEVIAASEGEQAIRLARSRRPALVVLDMGLPLIDGAAVADAIRDAYGDAVPFVVVTASRRIEDAAARIGAARYFTKPFDVPELVRAVRAALEPPPGTVTESAPPVAI